MSEIQEPRSSGEPNQPPWGNGSWTPPPPPPDWHNQGWQAPNQGWRDPRYEGTGWDAAGQGPGGSPQGPGAPGYPYWGAPQPGWRGPAGPGGPMGGGPGGWHYGWGPPRPRRSLPGTITALLLAVAVLVGLGIGHGVWRSVHNSPAVQAPSQGNGGAFGLNPFGLGNGGNGGLGSGGNIGSGSLSGVAAKVAPELVDINTSLSYQGGQAAGTGIVLTSDGYVLTNNHVISGATSIKATDIGNGQTYTATVVGYDRTHDVAVIKLQNASGLQTAKLGDSSKLTVGQAVVGIGNAGGVGGTPSTAEGQITALNQAITAQDESNGTSERLTGLIQTDANIQPGDSGGALVNTSAEVIGMNTAASTGFSFQTQGNEGFAIPISNASAIATAIRAGKASDTIHIGPTAFLGVEVDTSATASGTQGAVISGVIPGGAAASAGLTGGDVITSLGGSPVTSASSLTALIGRYHPGDRVSVGWTDSGGSSHTTTVTLASGPAA